MFLYIRMWQDDPPDPTIALETLLEDTHFQEMTMKES